MPDLNALVIFAKVVENSSFSKAARLLKMPTSTVSRKISELENNLGSRLLERSTRNLRLTDFGAEIYEKAQESAEIRDAIQHLAFNQTQEISGILKLSAPPNISDSLLVPLINSFQNKHPNVRVRTLVTERYVDPISDGIDIAFRVGDLPDSALIKQKILRYRHQLVTSPDYFKTNPAPKTPKDLLKHRLYAFAYWKPMRKWAFQNEGASEAIQFEPYVEMNDYAGLALALREAKGIGELPPIVSPKLIREGLLVEVMPKWKFRSYDLSLVHLDKKHTPQIVRLFKEHALETAPKLFPDLPT